MFISRQRHHEKTGLFNLEDEELTHFGQSLGDLRHFDGPVLSDDEKDDGRCLGDIRAFITMFCGIV